MTKETNDVVGRAKALALAGDFSPDDLGGDIGTMSLRNPDGPELLSIIQSQSARIAELEGERDNIRYHAEQIYCYIAQGSISEKHLASARFHNNKIRASLTKDSTSG